MHIRELDYFERNKKFSKYNLSQIGLDCKIKEIYIQIPKLAFKNARIIDSSNKNILFSTFSILPLEEKNFFKINFSKTNEVDHYLDFEPFTDSILTVVYEPNEYNVIVEVLFEKITLRTEDTSSFLTYCSIL